MTEHSEQAAGVDDEFEQLEANPYGIVAGVATRWLTKDKRNLLIAEMADTHVQFSLRMVQRKMASNNDAAEHFTADAIGEHGGEDAQPFIGDPVAYAAAYERESAPLLAGLRAELQRRGLPELPL